MPTSTLTSKGQVTVPKAIRDRLSLVEGEVLEFTVDDDGKIIVRRRGSDSGICGFLRDLAPQTPVSVEQMRSAVRKRAAEKVRRKSR